MANNNLPAIVKKENVLLTIFKRYIDKFSSKSINKQIIDNFTHIKQYGVLSMPAFRMVVDEQIKKSPEGSIIMTDINDLFVANKFRGKHKVNTMIKNIVDAMKNTLDESECSNYKMGKMGDEIYIYVPDKNEQETNLIVDKIHCIRESELTISSGASSNLSNGLISAINEADKKMAIRKSKFKTERLKSICGNNLEIIISNVVETQLDKMRIDLQQLKNSNKSDLRNSFDKAIEQLDIEEIISDINSKSNVESPNNEDAFTKLKDKYTIEAKLLHGDNPQMINEYVLAHMLSKHTVEGVVNSEFFQGLGYKEAYREIQKDKDSKTFDILAIDLSGLKSINDTLGHEEGDNAISDALLHLQTALKSKNIKIYSEIVAKGGGNAYALIEQLSSSTKDEIMNNIAEYGISENSKYNMSIICSIQSINKDEFNKTNFMSVVNTHLTNVENDLQEQSFNRKLKDVEEIKNSIKKTYQQIINMDDIQTLLNDDLGYKEKVLEMVKTGFENCIEKERDNSSLSEQNISIDLEKEPSNLKDLNPKTK